MIWPICTIIYDLSAVMMILRIYALYGQSREILAVLLFIYAGELVVSLIAGIIYSRPGAVGGVLSTFMRVCELGLNIPLLWSLTVLIPPAPDPTVCVIQYHSWNWGRYSAVPVVVLQGLMCLLAIYQSLRQSLQLYRATGRWQFNKYFKLLLHQGVLYFLMYVFIFAFTINTDGADANPNEQKFSACNSHPGSLQLSYRPDAWSGPNICLTDSYLFAESQIHIERQGTVRSHSPWSVPRHWVWDAIRPRVGKHVHKHWYYTPLCGWAGRGVGREWGDSHEWAETEEICCVRDTVYERIHHVLRQVRVCHLPCKRCALKNLHT